MRVEAIHNDEGYRLVREKLAEQQNVNNQIPYMNVVDVDVWGSRRMTIEHRTPKRHMLDEADLHKTLYHLTNLWGYSVRLKTIDDQSGELLDQYEGFPDLDDHTADSDDD
jgi:spore cortex formation protein SpoVR/YcgB (stage V sporulation)